MPLFFAKSNAAFKILEQKLEHQDAGGFVSFFGHVRAKNLGKDVAYLDYEAHETLAQSLFAELETSVKKRFGVLDVLAIHRLERVELGEPAVLITTCAPHRHEAFLATRFLIDELKKQLPIWKREVYVDQTWSWDQGTCACAPSAIDNNITFRPVARALKARDVEINTLHNKRVLLIGAGGLGCPIAIQLAATGLGQITICDPDVVHQSNLARQFAFKESDVGLKKVNVLKQFVEERMRSVTVTPLDATLNDLRARELFSSFDLVIDATDCAETKRLTKEAAYRHQMPLISASVYQLEGDVQVYVPAQGACLACHAGAPDDVSLSCQNTGIMTHVCVMVAAVAVEKAVQVLSKQIHLDAHMVLVLPMHHQLTSVTIAKDPGCRVCGPKVSTKKLVRLSR